MNRVAADLPAVHRDGRGELHAISAVCTHMGSRVD
jgi:phenylpropionate dioxygenase-like ring-hydroxylating dioxygenase large terminal subunit